MGDRLASPRAPSRSGATRSEGVLLLDSGSPLGVEAIHVQALELFMRRAGLRVLLLSAGLAEGRFRSALRALEPEAVVICGSEASLNVLSDPLRALRTENGPAQLYGYRAALLSQDATVCLRSATSRQRRRKRCSEPSQARHTGLAAAGISPVASLAKPRKFRCQLRRVAQGQQILRRKPAHPLHTLQGFAVAADK